MVFVFEFKFLDSNKNHEKYNLTFQNMLSLKMIFQTSYKLCSDGPQSKITFAAPVMAIVSNPMVNKGKQHSDCNILYYRDNVGIVSDFFFSIYKKISTSSESRPRDLLNMSIALYHYAMEPLTFEVLMVTIKVVNDSTIGDV